jgi:pimeloyl-ACP methyl ester carboxylesterase
VLLVVLTVTFFGTLLTEVIRIYACQERPSLSRSNASRLIREWLALVLFGLTTPLALLPSRPQRGIGEGSQQVPVIVIPGYALHRVGLLPMAAYLRRRQNRIVWAVNNPTWRDDIPEFARTLSQAVDRIRAASGSEQVDIVGHSMGGIVAAHYINHAGGAGIVRRLVTLGTPWRGTTMHILGLGRQCHGLAPGSPEIEAASPVDAAVTALWSATDAIILPTINASLEGARSVALENQGHVSMLFSLTAMRAVDEALSRGGEE